jgi:hypothetical protein
MERRVKENPPYELAADIEKRMAIEEEMDPIAAYADDNEVKL